MRTAFRSRRAGVFLLALLTVQMGCTVTNNVPVASNPPPAELTGLTTKSGKVVVFEPKGAIISRDTLYANTKEGQIVVAVDSIKTLSTKQVSTSRTIGLVLITAVVVYGFVILANKTAGHSYSNPP